jgi:nucleotide-binding universal stress UspA family protein
MSKVLAAIDNSAAARPVLSAAVAVAGLLGAEVEAVHAREDGYRTALAAAEAAGVLLRETTTRGVRGLVEAAEDSDVAQVVLGARATHAGRRPAGHVALELARSVRKPLVVVPPEVSLPVTLRRILVPLDGTRATADALAATVRLACRSKLEVIALHVYEYADLPLFSDQPQHELDAWTHEFLRRHSPDPDLVTLETRVGVPGDHVLRVARDAGADMVALGWSQHLDQGRAAVVREVLGGSPLPVLLVPIDARLEDDPVEGWAGTGAAASATAAPFGELPSEHARPGIH